MESKGTVITSYTLADSLITVGQITPIFGQQEANFSSKKFYKIRPCFRRLLGGRRRGRRRRIRLVASS